MPAPSTKTPRLAAVVPPPATPVTLTRPAPSAFNTAASERTTPWSFPPPPLPVPKIVMLPSAAITRVPAP
ncbi:MAG: hypothetical protein U0797_21445 [Gemmataceae bacterium]